MSDQQVRDLAREFTQALGRLSVPTHTGPVQTIRSTATTPSSTMRRTSSCWRSPHPPTTIYFKRSPPLWTPEQSTCLQTRGMFWDGAVEEGWLLTPSAQVQVGHICVRQRATRAQLFSTRGHWAGITLVAALRSVYTSWSSTASTLRQLPSIALLIGWRYRLHSAYIHPPSMYGAGRGGPEHRSAGAECHEQGCANTAVGCTRA